MTWHIWQCSNFAIYYSWFIMEQIPQFSLMIPILIAFWRLSLCITISTKLFHMLSIHFQLCWEQGQKCTDTDHWQYSLSRRLCIKGWFRSHIKVLVTNGLTAAVPICSRNFDCFTIIAADKVLGPRVKVLGFPQGVALEGISKNNNHLCGFLR